MNYIDKQEVLNDFASKSFRNTADQDYIAARMSYRAGLLEPFLWSSFHAIEKYSARSQAPAWECGKSLASRDRKLELPPSSSQA